MTTTGDKKKKKSKTSSPKEISLEEIKNEIAICLESILTITTDMIFLTNTVNEKLVKGTLENTIKLNEIVDSIQEIKCHVIKEKKWWKFWR